MNICYDKYPSFILLVKMEILTCLEFSLVNGARIVPIIIPKCRLPVCDVLPQRTKLLEIDSATVVPIKHAWGDTESLHSTVML